MVKSRVNNLFLFEVSFWFWKDDSLGRTELSKYWKSKVYSIVRNKI